MTSLSRKTKVLFLCVLLMLLSSFVLSAVPVFAAEAQSSHSDVLDDLHKDENFDGSKYPIRRSDYSLKVIQVAESTENDLLVYVYQPSCDSKANAVCISIAEQMNNTDGLTPTLYSLELLSTNGVYNKYKVLNYHIPQGNEHFYNIVMIQRNFVSGVDSVSDDSTTTDRKAYGVGQYWYITKNGNDVSCRMLETDVVTIIDPYVDFVVVNKNNALGEYFSHNYFVAFNTDRNIQELLSARVSYRKRDFYHKGTNWLWGIGDEFWQAADLTNECTCEKDIYADEAIEVKQWGYLKIGNLNANQTYTWSRIQSSSDFIATAGASSEANAAVSNTQWVLMFDECSVTRTRDQALLMGTNEETGQCIDMVTILRLEFVEDGETYNLGAVSDTVSGELPFEQNLGEKNDEQDILELILMIIFFVLGVIIFIYVIKFFVWLVRK